MAEATPLPHPAARALQRSPFAGVAAGEWPDRDGRIGVRLSAYTLDSLTQVATWPQGADALCAALALALDCAVPARTGAVLHAADVPTNGALGRLMGEAKAMLVRSGPEEFLLISDEAFEPLASLRQAIASDVGSVTELGHARCRIRIEGERCCDTLSKLFAIDLRETALPLGRASLTGHHHLPAMLYRRGTDSFDIFVFTTYARGQLSTLIDAALESGVSLAERRRHRALKRGAGPMPGSVDLVDCTGLLR